MLNESTKRRELPLLLTAMMLFSLLASLAACVPQQSDTVRPKTTVVAGESFAEKPTAAGNGPTVVTASATTMTGPTPTPSPASRSTVTATPVPPPPWRQTPLPVLGLVTAPPTTGCVVYQNGRVADAQAITRGPSWVVRSARQLLVVSSTRMDG